MISIFVLVLLAGILIPLILSSISNALADIDYFNKIKKQEEKIKAQEQRTNNRETIYD